MFTQDSLFNFNELLSMRVLLACEYYKYPNFLLPVLFLSNNENVYE